MLPGPTNIRRCSFCRNLIAESTLRTWNTFGARGWTDGKMEAPMRPDKPLLASCPHCNGLVWIEEQEQIGKIGGTESLSNSRFKDAAWCENPRTHEYFNYLAQGVVDPKKEKYVRQRAWWAGNDLRREWDEESRPSCLEDDDFGDEVTLPPSTDGAGLPPAADGAHTMEPEGARPRSDAEIANMRAYTAMLDEADEVERLTKAEVMRELGLFSEAAALLSTSYGKELSWAVAIIRELVEQRTTLVKGMKSR